MRISKVNIIQPKSYLNTQNKFPKLQNTGSFEEKPSLYSLSNLQANFLPNFNGKKVGATTVIHRSTKLPVRAEIRKETIGDYETFSLIIDRKEAGFLTMKSDVIYPEPQHVMTLPTDNIPKVTHLRSIDGDKYAGIGTALIKTAIQESYNKGSYGNLWLTAEKGYEKTLSPYRSDENPIPFYYKAGFKCPNEKEDKYITKCLKNNNYADLPIHATLLLTQEAKNKYLNDLIKNPIIKFKKTPIAS